MKRVLGFGLVFLLMALASAPGFGQSALKELEEKIRKQVGAGQPLPAPAGQAASGAMLGHSPAPAKAALPNSPGYLGIVADDREGQAPGVRILEVARGGPGDRAGLRPNDVIVGLGGVKIRQLSEMAVIVQQIPPDGILEFEILRNDQPQTVRVTFGRRPPGKAEDPPAPQPALQPAAAPPQDVESRIAALERRIAELEQRIALLEQALRQPRGGP